jgi:hypothetical protein
MWKKVNELTNRNVKSTNINETSDDGRNIVTDPREIAIIISQRWDPNLQKIFWNITKYQNRM